MPFDEKARLLGFWSYSRDGQGVSLPLCRAMEQRLNQRLAPIGRVELFRDTAISHGHDWRRSIVENIAGSAIFFWMQSGRWLTSAWCRFELEMFCAQTERIARRFGANPDKIRQYLVVPIREDELTKAEWTALEPGVRARFYPLWDDSNVQAELWIAGKYLRNEDYPGLCLAVGGSICDNLLYALGGPESRLGEMLRFLATSDQNFIDEWYDRFPRADDIGIVAPAGCVTLLQAQRRIALLRGMKPRWTHPGLHIGIFLLPYDVSGSRGFGAAVAPFGGDPADQLRRQFSADMQPKVSSASHLLWPSTAAAAIADAASSVGLDLPGDAETDALLTLADMSDDMKRRMGWQSPVRNFWRRGPDGTLVGARNSGSFLPIILTTQLT